MKNIEKIKKAMIRDEKVVSLRPSVGQGTVVSKVRLQDGLRCEIEEGPWRLTADGSEAMGGEAVGPTPGVFGRAAIGSCLAMGYVNGHPPKRRCG